MSKKILHKRGVKANLPSLSESELGFVTDDKDLYVGSSNGNVRLLKEQDKTELLSEIETVNTQLAENARDLYERGINIKTIGAKGNGIDDDTVIIQQALNTLTDNGCYVFLPSGRYRITSPLIIKHDNTRIIGTGSSIILKDFEGNAFENTGANVSRVVLKDFTVDGQNNGGHGFFSARIQGSLGSTGAGSMLFDNTIFIRHGGDGVRTLDNYVTRFVDGDYNNNGGHGIYLSVANGVTLDHVNVFNNNVGICVTGGSFSVALISCTIQECKYEGIKLGACYAVTILNPYMEKNGSLGASSISCELLDGDRPTSVSIINPYISGIAGVTPHAIHLKSSRFVEIHNPRFSVFSNEAVKIESDSWLTTLYGINAGINTNGFVRDLGSRTSQYAAPNKGVANQRLSSSNLITGFCYYDTEVQKPLYWDGSDWLDATGRRVWTPNRAYAVNAIINCRANQYKCTVAGTTSTTIPTHTSGTAVDGTVTWEFVKTIN